MNYKQTIDYLYSQLPVFHRVGQAAYKANLDNTLELSRYLNFPEKNFKSIHIAGTNGKGSVANMLASILQEAGYRTGLCTSPHLRDFRERIRVNGKMVPKAFVTEFVNKHKSFLAEMKPSFFEMFIAMTFDYFAQQNLDIAVIETGMGGRLDSTNIISPELSIITNIGMDHTRFLGNTIEKIAAEKAGIIKNNIPVIIGRKQRETKKVFETKANEKNSELFYAEDNYSIIKEKTHFKHNRFWLELILDNQGKEKRILSDQWGSYQSENIITALQAIDVINHNAGFNISDNDIGQGFKRVSKNSGFEGRWQLKGNKPRIIFDTGHNIDGLSKTMAQLKTMNFDKLHFVLGMVDDKDVEGTLAFLPKDAVYYFCKPDVPRGLDLSVLEKAAKKQSLSGNSYSTVQSALDKAKSIAGPNDLVFVGGSTFVVAEVI
ncbi:MAG: folylpolyglutamate synthase/dihydrofolate synthase family protein [Bacteroidales bacterium]